MSFWPCPAYIGIVSKIKATIIKDKKTIEARDIPRADSSAASDKEEDFALETERLRLLPLSLDMAEEYWAYHKLNFRGFKDYLPYDTPDPPDYEDIEKTVRHELQMMKNNRAVRFLAFARSGTAIKEPIGARMPIGDVFLYNIIHGYSQSAHLAYSTDQKKQGMGYATEMTAAMIEFAFWVLGLHRLEINCMKSNVASIKVADKLGFKHEGTSRELQLLNGQWHDMERYSLLATEWEG